MLAQCRSAVEPFSQAVYTAERATVSRFPDPQVPADADPG